MLAHVPKPRRAGISSVGRLQSCLYPFCTLSVPFLYPGFVIKNSPLGKFLEYIELQIGWFWQQ